VDGNEPVRVDDRVITGDTRQGTIHGDPTTALELLRSGDELLDRGRWKRSIVEFTVSIGLDPTQDAAYASRAQAYLSLAKFHRFVTPFFWKVGRYAELAASDANKALRIAPGSIENHNLRSKIAELRGDSETAKKHADQVVALEAEGAAGQPLPGDHSVATSGAAPTDDSPRKRLRGFSARGMGTTAMLVIFLLRLGARSGAEGMTAFITAAVVVAIVLPLFWVYLRMKSKRRNKKLPRSDQNVLAGGIAPEKARPRAI